MSVLLSEEFEEVMSMAMVSPFCDIDGRSDAYEFLFEVDPVEGELIEVCADGYSIHAVDSADEPAVILREPTGDICGFYYRFSSWIDEEHRGSGLGVEMILAYADHFKDRAWEGDLETCMGGLGFSESGYAIHVQAQQKAAQRAVAVSMDCGEEVSAAPRF
ncbi:hypothetical protein [Salipiger sp. PrR003]|uniref:hypothetical protein n=1 Tax=Salipiger sp. PrR003 TaxID=2706776 RepID=UPI0013DA2B10|nr:hypothetical protein [Salipiger sp. PrR003]NDV52269.1 hypothetical protein [Salipiger sp. PrR003]